MRAFGVLLLLGCAAVAARSTAQESYTCGRGPKEYAAGRAYWSCAVAKGRYLERSGERPADVATAAINACATLRLPIVSAVEACGGDRPLSDGMIAALDVKLTSKIIGDVVTLRAKRRRF